MSEIGWGAECPLSARQPDLARVQALSQFLGVHLAICVPCCGRFDIIQVMGGDPFNDMPSDPIADLPQTPLERAMNLRNGLLALCEGRGRMNDAVYRLLRREFMNDPILSSLVPRLVKTAQDTGAVWGYLKNNYAQWEPRRQFIRSEFTPLIDRLERGESPADALISNTLTAFDAEAITEAWNKALARREADPAGSITAARTLLEGVCKHLLEDTLGNPTYGENDDLPKLYRQVSEQLNIAPSQHSEDAFKRILGGATSIVEGLGSGPIKSLARASMR